MTFLEKLQQNIQQNQTKQLVKQEKRLQRQQTLQKKHTKLIRQKRKQLNKGFKLNVDFDDEYEVKLQKLVKQAISQYEKITENAKQQIEQHKEEVKKMAEEAAANTTISKTMKWNLMPIDEDD